MGWLHHSWIDSDGPNVMLIEFKYDETLRFCLAEMRNAHAVELGVGDVARLRHAFDLLAPIFDGCIFTLNRCDATVAALLASEDDYFAHVHQTS